MLNWLGDDLTPKAVLVSPACATEPYRCVSAPSRERNRPLTLGGLLLGDDRSTLRATRDPGFLLAPRRGPAARKSSASPPPVAASRRERAVYGDHRRRRAWTVSMISVLSMPWR